MTETLKAQIERLVETLKAKRHVSTLPGMDGMCALSTQTLDEVLALLPAEHAALTARVRALVETWRRRAHELRYNPGAMPYTANRVDDCADELAALLTPEKGLVD